MGENAAQGRHIRTVGALAGIGSGLTKVAVGHGFDTVKTRLQCSPAGTYHGALDILRKLLRNEGVFALYKGATPPAAGWAAIDSVLLGSLHNYRLFLMRQGMIEIVPGTDIKRLTLTAHGIAGLFAGLTSATVATPIELLKVKLQLQLQRSSADRQFKGPIDCARQVVRAQGLTGLWTGFSGSLAFRSNFFWMFLSFEALMRGFSQLKGTRYEMSTGLSNFLSGGLGSLAFWTMGIPFDNPYDVAPLDFSDPSSRQSHCQCPSLIPWHRQSDLQPSWYTRIFPRPYNLPRSSIPSQCLCFLCV
jgi:solute carrier family 25 carnitine/acylcarnitine transporter 20/29